MPIFAKSRIYQVSAETLFKLLVKDSLKEFGVDDFNRQDLKGLKTTKKYQSKGEESETTLEIHEYIKNERYQIETRLKDILYVVDVKIEVIDDKKTKLTYSEIISSTKKFKRLSLSFIGFLSKSKFVTKINGILDQVENKLEVEDNQETKID
jgi:hypothetical protein